MVIHKHFKATCCGCGVEIDLYNYEGLDELSRMGCHHCEGISKLLEKEPNADLFRDEREVK